MQPVVSGRGEEVLNLRLAERLHLVMFRPWRANHITRIPGDQLPTHSLLQGSVKHRVRLMHTTGEQPLSEQRTVGSFDRRGLERAQTEPADKWPKTANVQVI